MPKPDRRIDPRVTVGPVHLAVANLDRSLAFYEGVLGFEITRRTARSAALASARGERPYLLLTAEDGAASLSPARGAVRFGLRYPTRAALADALRGVRTAAVAIDRATTDGITETIQVRDPDGHHIDLYHDLPGDQWPRGEDGTPQPDDAPLDLDVLARAGEEEAARAASSPDAKAEQAVLLSDATRARLRDMRIRLLNLHKVLLEDARSAYEMDRGRIGSNANLLQLVINDPWFAWLHPLSELVVRIDEALRPEAPATETDGVLLLDQVARLLSPEHHPDEFGRRYYEALQRQPAVIVAHAEVRRILKQAK